MTKSNVVRPGPKAQMCRLTSERGGDPGFGWVVHKGIKHIAPADSDPKAQAGALAKNGH